jgi:hypothetical protein
MPRSTPFPFSFITTTQPGVTVSLLIGDLFITFEVLAGWSALYFAINYYLIVEQQIDEMRALELQASTAQLAMLRYQLNPHFLFNTLNSISTLVLLETDRTGQCDVVPAVSLPPLHAGQRAHGACDRGAGG